jgi:hypothetical protein
MKMGNARSPWRYDREASVAIHPEKPAAPKTHMKDDQTVLSQPQWGIERDNPQLWEAPCKARSSFQS